MVKSKDFENKIDKNIGTLKTIYFFGITLEAFATFFICAILLALLGTKFYYAFFPAILFVILRRYLIKPNYNKVAKIERGNPELEEKLRAAYDNINEDNPIVRELVGEVTKELDGVQTDKFINSKKVSRYIALNVVCVFILLFLLLSGFEMPGLANALGFGGAQSSGDSTTGGQGGSGSGGGSGSESELEEMSETPSAGKGDSEDIFGEYSVAKIEGEEFELEIRPGYGEGEAIDDEDGDLAEQANTASSKDASATAAGTYSEEIPVEMEEVVRKYFERLAEGG